MDAAWNQSPFRERAENLAAHPISWAASFRSPLVLSPAIAGRNPIERTATVDPNCNRCPYLQWRVSILVCLTRLAVFTNFSTAVSYGNEERLDVTSAMISDCARDSGRAGTAISGSARH